MHACPSPSVAILADDLTGAAEGAAPFMRQGLLSVVSRSCLHRSSQAEVIAADMATRSMSLADATLAVGRLTAVLSGARLRCKTVESTLRGHLRGEMRAGGFGAPDAPLRAARQLTSHQERWK
jgi:uncharacterized protein YgbK (DUF1537 family)